jgi:hypothetical protein
LPFLLVVVAFQPRVLERLIRDISIIVEKAMYQGKFLLIRGGANGNYALSKHGFMALGADFFSAENANAADTKTMNNK